MPYQSVLPHLNLIFPSVLESLRFPTSAMEKRRCVSPSRAISLGAVGSCRLAGVEGVHSEGSGKGWALYQSISHYLMSTIAVSVAVVGLGVDFDRDLRQALGSLDPLKFLRGSAAGNATVDFQKTKQFAVLGKNALGAQSMQTAVSCTSGDALTIGGAAIVR